MVDHTATWILKSDPYQILSSIFVRTALILSEFSDDLGRVLGIYFN